MSIDNKESQMSSQTIIRIVVNGAAGRMGSRICELAHHDAGVVLVGAVEHASSPRIGHPAATSAGTAEPVKIGAYPGTFANVAADVVIDFSSTEGTRTALALAESSGAALLVGTTGLDQIALDMLRKAAANRPVLLSPNTSLGITVLARLVQEAAKNFLHEYDCSIVEAHHSAKKDAPSGTALRLASAARAGGAALRDDQVVALRGGDVVGEHMVRFAGAGEYIELTHRATSRDLFVRGALRCARWLSGRSPGWYTMEDVLDMPAR
jgi:4-hydroxy-tetrahydrodipicolinate reductase